jgi:hypothetical protein
MADRKKKSEFPVLLFVRVDENSETPSGPDLLAFRTEGDAVEGDGPTTVARYRLVTEYSVRKVVESDE